MEFATLLPSLGEGLKRHQYSCCLGKRNDDEGGGLIFDSQRSANVTQVTSSLVN